MPEYPIPQDGEVGTWGAKIREALAILNGAIESNILSIQDINVFLNSMPDYVEADDYNSAISNINDELALKAESEHQHDLVDIPGLVNLIASVSNAPTLTVSGRDPESQNITIIASINTLAPFLLFNFDVRFGEEKVEKKDSDGEVVIQKPARSESLWDTSGECTLTVYVTVKNRYTGAVSPQGSFVGVCHRYNYIDMDALVNNLSNATAFVNNVADVSATKVLTRVLAIQENA